LFLERVGITPVAIIALIVRVENAIELYDLPSKKRDYHHRHYAGDDSRCGG